MMINSASSTMQAMQRPQQSEGTPFTDSQKTELSEIVGKYDLENMSETDKTDMRMELKEAGFERSAEMRSELEALGVDFSGGMSGAAGGGGRAGGMPGGMGAVVELESTQQSLLEDIIAGYDTDAMSDQDRKDLRTELQEAGFQRSPSLMAALKDLGINNAPVEVDEVV